MALEQRCTSCRTSYLPIKASDFNQRTGRPFSTCGHCRGVASSSSKTNTTPSFTAINNITIYNNVNNYGPTFTPKMMSSAYPPLQPLVAGQQSFHKHQLPQVGRSLEVQPPVTRQRELPSPYNHLLPHSSSNPKHVAEKSPQVLSAPSPPHTAPAQAPVREDEGELHMLENQSILIYCKQGDRTIGCFAAPVSLAGFRDVGQQVIDKVNSDEWKAHERESTPTLVEDHDPEYDSKSDASLCDVPSEDESVPEQLSWADFKPFIPAYVKDVSFTVDSETMRTQDHEALRTFFPGVHIQHSKHEESKEIQTELVTQEHIPEYFYPITTHSIVPVEKEDACLQSQGTQTDLPNERQYKSQGIQALVVKVKYNPHFPDAEPVPAVLNQVTYDEGTQTQNQNVWNKGTQTHFVKFKYTTESQGTQNARSTKCVASSQIRCTQTRPILVFDFPPDPENTESGTTPDASVLQAEALIAPEEGVIHKDELPQLPLEDLARIETELSRADTIAEQILVHTPFFPTINRPTSHEAVASTVEASGGIERAVGTIEAYCKWAGKQTRQLGLTSGEGETSASVPGRPSTSHHPTPVKRKDSAGSTHSFVPPPSRYSSPSHESNDDTSVYTDILIRTIAGKHNIEFSNPKHLKEAYADWKTNQIVKCYGPRKYKLDPYYLNLVDLYIVGHHTKDKALMLEAFLTFQKTNFKWGGDVPTLDAALKAFQHLPHGSGLCKWITKFFSYEWETKKTAKTYTGLVEKFPTCSSEAIGAFLFEVAKTRSAHIKGGEVAVLKAWCKFHDHRNDDERRACEQVREEILGSKRDPTSLEELVKEQDEEMLEEAEKVIVEHGGRAIYAGTRPAKKRKASPEPETPRKRSRPRKSMGSG